MGFSLKRFGKGILDQINPFDNGKSWGNPTGQPRPAPKQDPYAGIVNDVSQINRLPRGLASAAIDKYQGAASHVFSPMADAAKKVFDSADNWNDYTPEFEGIIQRAQPRVSQGRELNELTKRGAGGTFNPADYMNRHDLNKREINMRPDQLGGPNSVLTHEGLHAAWDEHPERQQEFAKAYDQSVDEGIMNYLDRPLSGGLYPAYKGKATLRNTRNLDPDVINEAQAYLSEYPGLPKPLKNYYSRYIDVDRPAQVAQTRNGILDTLDGRRRLYRQQYRARYGDDY